MLLNFNETTYNLFVYFIKISLNSNLKLIQLKHT